MSDDKAVKIAREIVAKHGDGERLRARAALCKLSGHDEDGDVAEYDTYLVAVAYLRSHDDLYLVIDGPVITRTLDGQTGVETATDNGMSDTIPGGPFHVEHSEKATRVVGKVGAFPFHVCEIGGHGKARRDHWPFCAAEWKARAQAIANLLNAAPTSD